MVRGEVGSRAGPFIGEGRSVRGDTLSFVELQWPRNGGSGKIPAWTPADGILGRFGAV
jgi:hypothetical protein